MELYDFYHAIICDISLDVFHLEMVGMTCRRLLLWSIEPIKQVLDISFTQNSDSSITINSSGGGGGITALTGDVTASGSGSVAATLATVNSNVGTFGSALAIPVFTVNGKGLITGV